MLREERGKAERLRNKYKGYSNNDRSYGGYDSGNKKNFDWIAEKERGRESEERERKAKTEEQRKNEVSYQNDDDDSAAKKTKKKTSKKKKTKKVEDSEDQEEPVEEPQPEEEEEEEEVAKKPAKVEKTKKKKSSKTKGDNAVPALEKPPKDSNKKKESPQSPEFGDMDEAFGAFDEAPVAKPAVSKPAPVQSVDDFLLNVPVPSHPMPSSKPAEVDLFGNFNSAPAKPNSTPIAAKQNDDDLLFGGFSTAPSQQRAPQPQNDLFGGAPPQQQNQDFEVVLNLKGQPVSVKPKAPAPSSSKPANPSDPWGNLVNLGDLTGSMSNVSISHPQAPAPKSYAPPSSGYYNPGSMYPPPSSSGYGSYPTATPPPSNYGYGMGYPPSSAHGAAPMYSGMPYGAPHPHPNAAPYSNHPPPAADPFASMYSSARRQ